MPSFQITEPFVAGDNFFSMVDYYLALLIYLQNCLEPNDIIETSATNTNEAGNFAELSTILRNKNYLESVGFKYAKALFYCALLYYYDRFRNLDEQVVKKLFTWAFMLRVDMEYLGFDSVNRYALGIDGAYTNIYPIFSIISRARVHTDISNLTISVIRDSDKAKGTKWNDLYNQLKKINQI